MNNDLRKALELLRQARPRVEGMHLAQGCRADQGHIGLLREIDAFLASQQAEQHPEQAEGAQGEREMREAFEQARDCDGLDFIDGQYWLRPVPGVDDELASVNADWWLWQEAWAQSRAALAQPSPAGEFGDAYQGAREDLAIWKRRALEAEQALREERILTERLGNALNDENGPTFMGEPNVTQPSPAPELDFAKPLETASGEPVKWVCSDVIEYKSARVCVDQNTGLVYSSPYIGLKIRNVMPAPELERPEVVAWVVPISGMNKFFRTEAEAYAERADYLSAFEPEPEDLEPKPEPLMTVAQHDRIAVALRAELEIERQRLVACSVAALGYFEGCADVYRSASLNDVLKLRAECDAAKARVAELEKQEPVAVVCEVSMHHSGETDVIDKHLPCGTKLYAAPVAQAGQLPDEMRFEYRHPSGERHTVTVSREQVLQEMPDFIFEALCDKFCRCEPIGETNVVECRCDELVAVPRGLLGAACHAIDKKRYAPRTIAKLREYARLNGRTVSERLLRTLVGHATGEIKHLNNGMCPDELEGHDTRDSDCAVCRALLDEGKEDGHA